MEDEIKVVRTPEVVEMTKLSRTTLWRRVRRGDFPAPMRLGAPPARAKGWLLTDVVEWINGQTWSPPNAPLGSEASYSRRHTC